MPEYDREGFQPPAPLARVEIGDSQGSRIEPNVPMLLDSGADVTLIPASVAAALSLEKLPRRYELLGYDGQGGAAEAVIARLLFLGRTYRGQFLVIDQHHGILGRNILNTVSIVLDGPRLEWR